MKIVGSVVAASITSILILTLFLFLQDSSDFAVSEGWLGFLGAIVGAILAIWGAIWAEEKIRAKSRNQNLFALADGIVDLGNALVKMREIANAKEIRTLKMLQDLPANERGEAQGINHTAAHALHRGIFTEIRNHVQFVKYFLEKQPVSSARLWIDLQQIEQQFDRGIQKIPIEMRERTRYDKAVAAKIGYEELYRIAWDVEALFGAMASPTFNALKQLDKSLGTNRANQELNWRTLEAATTEEMAGTA